MKKKNLVLAFLAHSSDKLELLLKVVFQIYLIPISRKSEKINDTHCVTMCCTDLLKANSFAQPIFLNDNFAQRNGPKMP